MMRWLHTLLCGICVLTVAWIVVTNADGAAIATDDVLTFMGDPETTAMAQPALVDLTDLPAFETLRARPLRSMSAPAATISEREWAAHRHAERLAEARRENALLAIEETAPTAQRSTARSELQRRRDFERARRMTNHRAQKKYERRSTTTFERSRHYKNNRYAYEYSNSNGRRNARLDPRRGIRVPVATSRRR